MTNSPEIQPQHKVPEGVSEFPSVPEIPKHIEQGGVKATPTQFTAAVSDDNGQPLIQTPQTQSVTIQIPADQDQLEDWSKSGVGNSITWYALFWLRLIKKAIKFGWRVVVGGS